MAIINCMELSAIDASLGMGQSDSADWAQRISLILANIILYKLDSQFDRTFQNCQNFGANNIVFIEPKDWLLLMTMSAKPGDIV